MRENSVDMECFFMRTVLNLIQIPLHKALGESFPWYPSTILELLNICCHGCKTKPGEAWTQAKDLLNPTPQRFAGRFLKHRFSS